jgi:uncharacterized protein (TIGR03663 family)
MKSRDRNRRRQRTGAGQADSRPGGGLSDASGPVSRPPGPGATSTTGPADRTETQPADAFDRWFVPIAVVIIVIAAALRLPDLAINPFHHDEGVNGFFTTNLVRQGTYVYDPANYHGPTLYYFALVSATIFGLTTEAMRLVPVLFGLLLVGLTFGLRPYIGSLAALVAGGLLAVSPGAVYISRYFIHETLLVACSLALVVSLTFYLDRRAPKYLLAAAVSAALLFATKETGIITVIVLLIATVIGHYYTAWRRGSTRGAGSSRETRPKAAARSVWIDGVEYRAASGPADAPGLLPAKIPAEHLAGAAVVFLVIYVLLFSSFFTNFPKGLLDSLATFTIWTQTGGETQTQPLFQYLVWTVPLDVAILVLGVVGGLLAAIRAPSRLWVAIGLWAAGISVAYSIISYKTPWILLNMLLPLALLGGLAASELWRNRRLRLGVPVVLGAAALVSSYQAVDLNYSHYDDPTYAYVFVHSTRDMLNLIDEIEATADRAGTGRETGIVFFTPDYWPLPWYFRDYPRAGFFGSIVDTEEPVIVAKVDQEAEVGPALADRYDRIGVYTLRPGVDLVLFVRRDVPKG